MSAPHVYTDNPLKQGLKPRPVREGDQGQAVYTDNPLKQGLKPLPYLDRGLIPGLHGQSIKTRVEAARRVAGPPYFFPSTRTIH